MLFSMSVLAHSLSQNKRNFEIELTEYIAEDCLNYKVYFNGVGNLSPCLKFILLKLRWKSSGKS